MNARIAIPATTGITAAAAIRLARDFSGIVKTV